MNLPAKLLGNTNLQQFDVIVIGSGAGGSSIAAILARWGKKVLILEAGPNYFLGLDNPDPAQLSSVFSNDELKLVRRRLLMPDTLIKPIRPPRRMMLIICPRPLAAPRAMPISRRPASPLLTFNSANSRACPGWGTPASLIGR